MNGALKNTAALPATDQDEDRYPILGHLVWYGLSDVRIDRTTLLKLIQDAGLPMTLAPPEIRAADAFRRATTAIATRTPQATEDGKFENIMVREVSNDRVEIVRHIIREVVDSKNKRVDYGKIGHFVFDKETIDVRTAMEPGHTGRFKQKVDDLYLEFRKCYTGKHIRDMVYKALYDTHPVNVRPAGGVYFVSRTHASLVEGLEQLIVSLNRFITPNTCEAVFESVPMLDIEKQRRLIFDKYESQSEYSVDVTLGELAKLLSSEKTPSKTVLANYINKVKELKSGIRKYEGLLERDLDLSRAKCVALQQQVLALMDKAAVSDITGEVSEDV